MNFASTIISFCSGLTDSCCRFLRQHPSESLCLCISYAIYLYTGDIVWAYYGIPVLFMSIWLKKKLNYSLLPVIYFLYMHFASSIGFSSAVFTSSFVAATGATVLYCKRFNPYPGWTLIMLSLSAMYLTAISAILLTGCLLLSIMSGIVSDTPDIVHHIFGFSAFIVFPLAVITSLQKLRKFTLRIPAVLKWTQLFLVESLIVVMACILLFSSVQISLTSRVPKPYVIYVAVFFIFICEFSFMLHSLVPRTWYNAFFRYRNIIYIPILFMGCASLYIEFSIVGFRPRTFIVSCYTLWLLLMSVLRISPKYAGFFNTKSQTIFFFLLFICSIILSAFLR